MNSTIDEINSYPFERLRNLIDAKQSNGEINLSIGEPKHEANPKVCLLYTSPSPRDEL